MPEEQILTIKNNNEIKRKDSIEEKELQLEKMIAEFNRLKKEYDEEEEKIDTKLAQLEEELKKLEEEPEIENIIEPKIEENKNSEPIDEIKPIKFKKENTFKKSIYKLSATIGSVLSSLNNNLFEIEEGQENLSKIQKIGAKISFGINKLYEGKNENTEVKNTRKENIAEKKKADVEFERVIDNISEEDKKILIKEMKESVPLDFEPEETKKDYKLFIKNQIVKLISGFKISNAVKKILERPTKKILMTMAVMTLWTNGDSFIKPNGIDGEISSLKNKEIVNNTPEKINENIDMVTYNQLSENGKRTYLYAISNIQGNYIIVDKPQATMYIINKDKKITCSIPVLLGKMKGETANRANPESDVAIGATTPAGKYKMTRLAQEGDLILYKGKIFHLWGNDKFEGGALHIEYPLEKDKRIKALKTQTIEDNRMSWGCINIDEEMWDKYIEDNIENRGTTLFVLPDEITTLFNPETGEAEAAT